MNKTKVMLLSQRSFAGILEIRKQLNNLENSLDKANPDNYSKFLKELQSFESTVLSYVDNYREEMNK